MNQLILKKREDKRILNGHLWIYSNEIDIHKTPLKNFESGELVEIKSASSETLGIGYINPKTLLCGRILTFLPQQNIDQAFFEQRISAALQYRARYFQRPYYRLIFGEGDYLPGLVVDRFGEHLVVQITTAGMENVKDLIQRALVQVIRPKSILWRNDVAIREIEGLPLYVETAYGSISPFLEVIEADLVFQVPHQEGQKTGWFYDQQYNRSRLTFYIKPGQRVLDVFSYVGAWGICAACFGAKEVYCIDSSAKALEWLKRNAVLNKVQDQITTMHGDAFDCLKMLITQQEKFDIIILDPPAFIKRHKDLAAGLKAYQRLHELAFSLLETFGTVITTSCSMHLSKDQLLSVIQKASRTKQKSISVIEQLHQAQDHPIHLEIPETNYLKGFVLIHRSGDC